MPSMITLTQFSDLIAKESLPLISTNKTIFKVKWQLLRRRERAQEMLMKTILNA